MAECDSVKTAIKLYKECEGREFEHSSNFLDLRFIPDDVTFEQDERDSARDVPMDYEAPDFFTSALQLTNVKLSWDQEDPVRAEKLRKRLSKDDIAQMDLDAYIGSGDESDAEGSDAVISASDSEDEAGSGRAVLKKKARNKYAALLGEIAPADDHDDEDMGDLEIVFEPGLKEAGTKILEKSQKKDDSELSVWDKYLEKRKEKKKARRQAGKQDTADADSLYDDDVDPEDDPFFDLGEEFEDKSSKKKEGREKKKPESRMSREEAARADAELELLTLGDGDDDEGDDGYNLKAMVKGQKLKKKGKKARRGKKGADLEEDNFKMDMSDSRFQAVFEKPEFHIDPTNPKFKPTAGSEALLAERQSRMIKKREKMETNLKSRKKRATKDEQPQGKTDDLKSLMESVKRKSEKHASRLAKSKKRVKR